MSALKKVDGNILGKMLEQTLIKFTGQSNSKDARLSLIKPNDIVGLVPTEHLNPTHDELVDVVKSSLGNAGIPKKQIKSVQGGPHHPKACTALIALPALRAHWLTGIGTVLKTYIMYSGNPSAYHKGNSAKLGEIWKLPYLC